MASLVRPDSTLDPNLQGAREMPPLEVAALAFGFLSERYWFFTQRPVPL